MSRCGIACPFESKVSCALTDGHSGDHVGGHMSWYNGTEAPEHWREHVMDGNPDVNGWKNAKVPPNTDRSVLAWSRAWQPQFLVARFIRDIEEAGLWWPADADTRKDDPLAPEAGYSPVQFWRELPKGPRSVG